MRIFAETNKLSQEWIIFIIVGSVVALIVVFLLFYLPLKSRYTKNKFHEHYYRRISSIVKNNDYYLINNFLFRVDESNVAKVDHVVFAEKYIYLINDYYYEGDITGNIDDSSLIYYSFKGKDKGKKYYTDNPFVPAEKSLTRLSAITGIDKSMFIGIILVNDTCNNDIQTNSNQYYIIRRKRLAALIKAIESRDVARINPEQLDKVVKSFDKLNRRKRK